MASTTPEEKADSNLLWVPIESNPEIMTDYVRMLSLTSHYLIDVPVIEGAEEMGIFKDHQVKAFIFLYEINNRTKSEVDEANSQQPSPPSDLFHMKQYVHNSCGSVALFHAYLNTVNRDRFEPESVLFDFFWQSNEESFEKRGQMFAESEVIRKLHYQAGMVGQTSVPDDLSNINYHYVAIVPGSDGTVYKLDGRCNKPVPMTFITNERTFIQAGLEAIQNLILRDPENFNFSILAFCGN
ncbi:Ubiquitin carboxyl-terminal hydrolase isozyme L3 [Blomia tropicalis]|nr:Ubiquitin carboxyl-terminal hydrolase isozyme L3 [Blomia tropicalis]